MAALDKLSIDTPEQVALDFSLATIGSRFLALAVDTLIQAAAILVLVLAALAAVAIAGLTWAALGVWSVGALLLAAFLVYYGYFAFFETIWNGQTPGKRLIGLRVIAVSGRPITTYEAILRNVVRIADQLPGLYAIGILSVFLTERSQRLGDVAAGTVVVHERLADRISLDAETAAEPPATRHGAVRLTTDEIAVMELFFRRRADLGSWDRARSAKRIASRVRERLGITAAADDEQLLEEVLAEYRASRRYR